MEKRYLELNGKQFLTCRALTASEVRVKYQYLGDCYNRPSYRKERIWDSWKDWFLSLGSHLFWVDSYNTMVFTIGGIIELEGHEWYVYITPTRQELYPMI